MHEGRAVTSVAIVVVVLLVALGVWWQLIRRSM